MPSTLVVAEVAGLAGLRAEAGQKPADEVLAVVARAVAGALRVGDVPYRFGPEQIAVLLPATAVEPAGTVCGRLAAAAAEHLRSAGHDGAALRATAIAVDGAAGEVVLRAEGALDSLRVERRWEPPTPLNFTGAA
jgi:GGDEF domain-containing protein